MGSVHLYKRKVYASDNCTAVELEVDDCDLRDAVFRPKDVRTLAAYKESPAEALLTDAFKAFSWSDGQWCRLGKRGHKVVDGVSVGVPRLSKYFREYWKEPRFELTKEWRKEVLPLLRDTGSRVRSVVRVTREQVDVSWKQGCTATAFVETHTDRESFWEGKAFKKAMRYAEAMDFDADPDHAPVPPPVSETPDCDYAAMGIVSIRSRRNWAGERWPCRSISQFSL